MIPLAAFGEIIDASGAAPRIEAMLPIGVRARQLLVPAFSRVCPMPPDPPPGRNPCDRHRCPLPVVRPGPDHLRLSIGPVSVTGAVAGSRCAPRTWLAIPGSEPSQDSCTSQSL